MLLKRVEDRKFMITLTESEALKISDHTEVDFHYARLLSNRIGAKLLGYMSDSCKFPHCKRSASEVDLFPNGS